MSKDKLISVDDSNIQPYLSTEALFTIQPTVRAAVNSLLDRSCVGNDFLGWLDLPEKTARTELERIKESAAEIRQESDHLILIGIGGSYLGARSAIEFILPPFRPELDRVLYYGHQLSEDYANQLFDYIADKEIYVNVISKSGGTTEPAVAFRLLSKLMKSKYGPQEMKKRIISTTDPVSGKLRAIANKFGYRMFNIPPDVGGRFSVLTPVGLLPIAVAGLDIDELLRGAKEMAELCRTSQDVLENPVLRYAAIRHLLYKQGKKIEVLSSFLPNLHDFSEWWKQLFGESEGKEQKGIFPASVNFTTDLHSMGQLIQEGERILFETFLSLPESGGKPLTLELEEGDPDGLNYLVGSDLQSVNEKAYLATARAHLDGGVPNMTLNIPARDEYSLGQLYYFFEFAVAVSGLLLGINPFNQPGVEAYKTNMFKLLGKPGY